MKKLISELKRMQLLAGLITESSVLQMMTPEDVGTKIQDLAKDFKLYLLPQAIELNVFSKKVESLNNDYSSLGQGIVGVMANTSTTGGVSLLIYAAEDVELLNKVYEALKKDFPTITKVGHNKNGGSYMKIEDFNKTV